MWRRWMWPASCAGYGRRKNCRREFLRKCCSGTSPPTPADGLRLDPDDPRLLLHELASSGTEEDLGRSILGCGDGPAAFNSALTRRGGCVVSCDPLYRFSAGQIRGRIEATRGTIMEQLRRSRGDYVWDLLPSPEALESVRLAAMEEFLADFEEGREEVRYLAAELPHLPFAPGRFDLALCSHLLFLYSGQLSLEFHRAALLELCRVAREVRIFPLLDLGGAKSPYVERLAGEFAEAGHEVELRRVPYEFQKGADEMMRVRASVPGEVRRLCRV